MAAAASSGRHAAAPPTLATNPKGVDSDGCREAMAPALHGRRREVAALMWAEPVGRGDVDEAGGGRPPLMSRRRIRVEEVAASMWTELVEVWRRTAVSSMSNELHASVQTNDMQASSYISNFVSKLARFI
uniref:Uncharacterized protein n=1 Tax=Oryza meridionalis TaxID=40149 RepID=A0A0E0F7U4_9ORYZ